MSDPNSKVKQRQLLFLTVGVGGVALIALVGMVLFDSQPSQRRERTTSVNIAAPGNLDDRDAWRAHQAAQEKNNEIQINEVKALLRAQEEQSQKLRRELDALKAASRSAAVAPAPSVSAPPPPPKESVTAPPKPRGEVSSPLVPTSGSVLEKPLPIGNGLGGKQILEPPTGRGRAGMLNQPLEPVTLPKREVEIITFGSAGSASEAGGSVADRKHAASGERSGQRERIEFLPAGSFVRVAMLNGVDAPTGGQAQSNPLPVAFHVLDTANLANKHRLDIRDCRIIASTWGDLSSERMMGRTETLACIINGASVEMAIKGQVIGEDGKAGVRGRLVTKQGQLLANALFAGALSGIGRAVQSSSISTSTGAGGITQVLNPDRIGQAAIGGGVSSASQQLAQYYLKAADKLYPVIETDGGRTVEILITKGAVYSGSALVKDDYRGLLKRSGVNARRSLND